jgi:oxygen-dependent protoporphyrinogen oxidase
MVSVAIIGAGISGLMAAYRLRQRGIAMTIFEAAGRAGGVVRSERLDGYLVEYGPSSIEGTDPLTEELLRELDLEALRCSARQPTRKLAIVRRGQARLMPDTAFAFATSQLFSLSGKLRLLQEPFIKAGDPEQEESVAAFARRRLGREGSDYLLGTFVTSILVGDPERFSIQHALFGLSQIEQRYGSLSRGFLQMARIRKRQALGSATDNQPGSARTFSFRNGLQTLTYTLSVSLQEHLRLNTSVVRLQHTSAGWTITTRSEGREEQVSFDRVICTIPLYQLASLEIEPACDLTPLREVEYPPLSLLALGFKREQVGHSLEGTGIFVPVVEGRTLRATLFSSSVYPARAPEGHVLLTNFIGGACNPLQAQLSPTQLLDTILSELRPLLQITGQPTFSKHIYLNHSLPQYNVGYGRVLECIEQMEARLPGFFMAGNYRQGVSVRKALLSGHEAAERLLVTLVPERALSASEKGE